MDTADDHGQVILVMNIELAPGRFDQLIVHEEDEPDDLAHSFCERHSLGTNIVQALTRQIERNIDELITEQLETSRKTDTNSTKKTPVKQGIRTKVVKEPPKPKSISPIKKTAYTTLGHKLYYKALKSKENLEKKRSEAKKAAEERLNKSLTFKPQINKRPVKTGRVRQGKLEEELMMKGLKAKEKVEKQREEQEEVAALGLTFAPGINTRYRVCRSQKLAARSRSQDAFRSLYEDFSRRKERLEETFTQHLNTECPFRPTVNTSRERDKSEEAVELRLMRYQQQIDQDIER